MNCLGLSFDSVFAFQGDKNILKPKDMGIVNHHIGVATPYTSIAALEGLFAPPYVGSDFRFDLRLAGEIIKADEYMWLPNAIYRAGRSGALGASSLTALPAHRRAAIMRVRLENASGAPLRVGVQANVKGSLDYVHQWEFPVPNAVKRADFYEDGNIIGCVNNDKAWFAGVVGARLEWFGLGALWEGEAYVPAGGEIEIAFAFAMGEVKQALTDVKALLSDVSGAVESAQEFLRAEERALFDKLPRLSASDARVTRFYNRSLVHYITNRWEVPEFALNPYLSTNGINGGCLCSYLWDYSGGWKLHPLYEPALDKQMIKQFLKIDLSRAFAFTPVDGAAYGPWYPVNQEKIIALIYYYVLITGDIDFLRDTVAGKRIIEHVIEQATLKDDPQDIGALTDYGVDGEHHLELRRGIPYHGVLPDLNARRYMNYLRAHELAQLAGAPAPDLPARAAALKKRLRDELWLDDAGWFRFIMKTGADVRYTIQMFKLLDSPVLDDDMLRALLKHLNAREFLGEFGVHSMSKLDPAYDQVDIDNGGGGACTLFPILIAEKLYAIGKADEANDMLSRVLWWGERAPYWGDSFVANQVEYRQDTPLMATIGGVTGAQTLIFGAFGISAAFDGEITINPPAAGLCERMRLTDMRLRGKRFDVLTEPDGFKVIFEGKCINSVYGQPVTL